MRRWSIIIALAVVVVFLGYARADQATEVATVDPNDGDGDGWTDGFNGDDGNTPCAQPQLLAVLRSDFEYRCGIRAVHLYGRAY